MTKDKNPNRDYQTQVDRARERSTIGAGDVGSAAALIKQSPAELERAADNLPSAMSLVEDVTPATLQALLDRMQRGEVEVGEQFIAVAPGQQFTARLVRKGTTLLPDLQAKEGEAKLVEVSTWHFRHDRTGMNVSMVGSYMLDRQLPAFMGREVTVIRGEKMETKKGRRLSRYTCIAEREAIDVPEGAPPRNAATIDVPTAPADTKTSPGGEA